MKLYLDQPFARVPPCGVEALAELKRAWARECSRRGGGELRLYAVTENRETEISICWPEGRPTEYRAYYETSPGEGLSRLLDQLEAMKEPPLNSGTIAALRALRNVVW